MILLMEEILHQLIGCLSDPIIHKVLWQQVVQDFFHQQFHELFHGKVFFTLHVAVMPAIFWNDYESVP